MHSCEPRVCAADSSVRPITNFGGNIHFTPRHFYAPATEAEVLAILDRHANGKVRVVGSLHSWSPAVVCDDAVLDLRRLNKVRMDRETDGSVAAVVGGGCTIEVLLRKLHRLAEVTLPSLGLITEQTIAGAISTGTHGSGRHSLSHYVTEVRAAAYDAETGKARVYVWNDGAALRAARCAVGCMGVILSVKIRCVPRFEVAETIVPCATLDEVLAGEEQYALQQFFLVPHRWTYFAQRRVVAPGFRRPRRLSATIYRIWWFLGIDLGLHFTIKLLACFLQSPMLIRFFYRHLLSKMIVTNTTIIDHSDRMLVMEHELFRHLEMEVFVPTRHLRAAAGFVRAVLEVFDGRVSTPTGGTDILVCGLQGRSQTRMSVPPVALNPTPTRRASEGEPRANPGSPQTRKSVPPVGLDSDPTLAALLQPIGMYEELLRKRGSFTHHYAIAIRRVLADDTLISMSSGGDDAWYALSFITYVEPRDRFLAVADFLARAMSRLFEARLHWGKYFPLSSADVENSYTHLLEFRALCLQIDPYGVFRNDFAERVLFAGTKKALDSQAEGLIE